MIKDITIKDIEIGEELENNIISKSVSGKILKIHLITGEANSGVNIKIMTKEGELVLNTPESGVYYPRSNVSTQKMIEGAFNLEGEKMDYFYFNKRLLFNITKSNPEFEGIVIKKLTILYDDCSK